MGRLVSKSDRRSLVIDGVTLGFPTITREDGSPSQAGDLIDDLWFAWDDDGLPTGTIQADGSVV